MPAASRRVVSGSISGHAAARKGYRPAGRGRLLARLLAMLVWAGVEPGDRCPDRIAVSPVGLRLIWVGVRAGWPERIGRAWSCSFREVCDDPPSQMHPVRVDRSGHDGRRAARTGLGRRGSRPSHPHGTAAPASQRIDPGELQRLLDQLVAAGAPGAAAWIHDEHGVCRPPVAWPTCGPAGRCDPGCTSGPAA